MCVVKPLQTEPHRLAARESAASVGLARLFLRLARSVRQQGCGSTNERGGPDLGGWSVKHDGEGGRNGPRPVYSSRRNCITVASSVTALDDPSW